MRIEHERPRFVLRPLSWHQKQSRSGKQQRTNPAGEAIDFGKVPHMLSASCRSRFQMQATRPVVETVFRKLGGRKVLRERVTSEADLARLVHRRIPLRALIYVKRGGFSEQEIGRFIIPERTQRHRKAKRQPLTVAESDRVVRLMRIQALAEDVFGDAEKANRWLRENLAILDGKPPLELARTESGARVVEQMLAKIDWGAAA
jgi:putative toxin-antitoxin system antitoxin component (TIGR02293 family)